MACRHPDIQKFDEIRCCLSCGEAVFESNATLEPDSEESTSLYKYRRLNYTLGQEIRLIMLHPGSDQQDLTCDIVHVNLLDKPTYEAVSYTWGSHTLSGQILCNGRTMLITANCQAALRCLRLRKRIRALWVDAVCIDQTNNAEKGHQVQLMSTIYSTTVGGVKSALEYLNGLGNSQQILQEIGLAQLVTLVTEDACAHWTSTAVAAILEQCEAFGAVPPGAMTWAPAVQREKLHLLDALYKSRMCDATDERDKVFALLGLTQARFSKAIPVDYSLSSNDLYIEVACHMIMDLGCLDILKHTSCQPLHGGRTASWVPLWSHYHMYELLPIQFEQDTVELLAFSWFGPSKPSARMLDAASSPSPTHSGSASGAIAGFRYQVCRRIPEGDQVGLVRYIAPYLRIRAHYIDCVVTVARFDREPQATSKSTFTLRAFGDGRRCRDCHETDEQTMSRRILPGVLLSQREAYLALADYAGTKRTFFVTQHSRGFVRDQGGSGRPVRPEDQIWALAGANVPFVLRAVGSHYVLVQECFLHRATLPFPCAGCGLDAEDWPMTTEIIDIW
ncbi:heterokaryon incompatibility protein-domain-containing protein [Paraphoma chrysanthemicola]|uniref:Heterokaryon incompatibility protein-domain-containing protein n=1 Tax=Paraphoma chrysanthemicola TaxID=798071 RepID=A0A8K0VT86_9PLEO|nr:heterokaryon incompatibility protein-domain-containing protein [Paraphoma chrysanthemicola]